MNKLVKQRSQLQDIGQIIHQHMAAHKVERAYLFGSYARGEARSDSDIDVAVDMRDDADLLDLIGFKQALEAALDLPVDVTTRRSIAPASKLISSRIW